MDSGDLRRTPQHWWFPINIDDSNWQKVFTGAFQTFVNALLLSFSQTILWEGSPNFCYFCLLDTVLSFLSADNCNSNALSYLLIGLSLSCSDSWLAVPKTWGAKGSDGAKTQVAHLQQEDDDEKPAVERCEWGIVPLNNPTFDVFPSNLGEMLVSSCSTGCAWWSEVDVCWLLALDEQGMNLVKLPKWCGVNFLSGCGDGISAKQSDSSSCKTSRRAFWWLS